MKFYWLPVATTKPRFEFRIEKSSALLMTLCKEEDGSWTVTCLHKTVQYPRFEGHSEQHEVTENVAKTRAEHWLAEVVLETHAALMERLCLG